MNIAVVHLDLGQGGAERQTIDECIALQNNGHKITIYTSHHDPKRSFDETNDPSYFSIHSMLNNIHSL